MSKQLRLKLIHGDLQNALKAGQRPKVPWQTTPSVELVTYSPNPRVNSVMRTLVAFYGEERLFDSVMAWSFTPEGEEFSAEDMAELLASVKWTANFRGDA